MDQAAKFDRLVSEPGWDDVVEHLAERVNREITDAASCDPLKPDRKTLLVTRWDAMRTMLDEALSYVKTTREERDKILAMRREEETYVESASNAR